MHWPRIRGLCRVSCSVWLRANGTEISTARWAVRLGKDFTLLLLSPPSTMIPVQFMCLTVFLHNLSPSPLWSTSWSGTLHIILHTFFHPKEVAHTIATSFVVVPRLSIPSLSINSLLGTLSFTFVSHPSDHSYLCPLKCHFIYFPYRPGLTSMQHTTLHTTAVQSRSHSTTTATTVLLLSGFCPGQPR